MEYKISILLESSELYIERTNQRFQIQPLNCGKSDDEQKEIGSEMEEESASESRPREETPPADREIISPKSTPNQVHMSNTTHQEAAKQHTEV
ncbi:hypothetical protein DVH24_023396 [Malus domestica]|uniref:Uncharacterized protein n=1 Tax=Malus domestica TaxID=3750 RepID=A0A498KU09_MALDO|nr:hypothetical protein DVH24_023396 [Malus domestica]